MKFDVLLKQFMLKIPSLILSESYCSVGNTCCFTDCIKKIEC